MMNSIKLLDDKTINKIAAGEVIDRPSSVVKELVENSIDAKSTDITIEIVDGGKKYIRVTDNGIGIEKNEVDKAFLRHSTSKISKVEDLQTITTLGFRGEALASIASVSKLELITKVKEHISGTQVIIDDGESINKKDIGCPNGTTIIIRNLFYNVPVRQKFLKSDTVETSHISDIVYKLALGNPFISFKYIKDGSVIIRTPGKGDVISTAYSLFGKEFINSMFNVNYIGKNIKVEGLTCKPSYTRGNRSHQYIYVNNRYVKSSEISKSVENAYKSLIPINRFPIFILFISIEPNIIDVNVHPTKTEIRFENQEIINSLIYNIINEILHVNDLIPEIKMSSNKDVSESKQSSFLDKPTNSDGENDLYTSKEKKHVGELSYDNLAVNFIKNNENYKKSGEINNIVTDDNVRIIEYNPVSTDDIIKEENVSEPYDKIPEMNVIGRLFDTYIIAENKSLNEFYLIDQHAAHERIMYEKLKAQFESESVYTQELLYSDIINLTNREAQLVKDNIDIFKNIGFDIEEFGNNSVIVRGVPVLFGLPDSKHLLLDILDNLKSDVKSSYNVRLEKIMKMACTSAIKAGDNLKAIEISNLIKELRNTQEPFTCPHGRPIIIKMTKYELEKKFKRVQ